MFLLREGRAGLRRAQPKRAGGNADTDDLDRPIDADSAEQLARVERLRVARGVWEQRDLVNIERYDGTDGQHYWTPDPWTGVPAPPDEAKPDWRVEWSCPDIQSTIQQYAAKNAVAPVKYIGEPKLDASETRMAAAAAARCLSSMRRTMKLARKRNDACLRAMITGEVFGVTLWDHAMGTSEVALALAHEIFSKPGVAFEDSPWVFRERWEPIATTRARWVAPPNGSPDTKEVRRLRQAARLVREIEPSSTDMPDIVRARLQMAGGAGTYVEDEDLADFVRHLELFENPCDEYPQGRLRVWVNSTLIFDVPSLPYFEHGILIPIRRLSFFDVPGRIRGLGMMALGFSTQAIVEDLMNAQAENARMAAFGKIVHDERIDLSGKWTSEPAEAIAIPANLPEHALRVMRPPATDASVTRLAMFFVQKLNTQLGAQDPNRGIVNNDVTLGEVEIAHAEGEARMRSFYRDVDVWERDLLEMAIVLEQAMGSEERLEGMIGPDRRAELAAFRDARFIDLQGAPRTVEIVVQSAPSLSNNDALREAQVRARLDAKLITPEEARDVLEMPLAPGSISSSWDDNKRLLRELVERVRTGKPVEVHPLWDHGAMLQAAAEVTRQRDYIDAPPQEKRAIDELFQVVEREMIKRRVGAAAMRGDRTATGGAQAAAIGADPLAAPGGSPDTRVLTDPPANSTQQVNGPAEPDPGLAGDADPGL